MIHEHFVTHITATPFDNPHVKRIIDKSIRAQMERTQGRIKICDPFARESFTTKKMQGIDFTTNDLNEDMPTDYHLEANTFCQLMKDTKQIFDLVLFDPPYNLTQLKRNYDGIGKELELWQTLNPFGHAKNALAKLVPIGGHVIHFGFGSRGFGKIRGFEPIALYNLEPAGTENRYNIQVKVEVKVQKSIFDFIEEE